jgi:hypothetical protein
MLAATLALAVASPAAARDTAQGFELSVIVDGRTAPEYAWGGRLYIEARKGCEFRLRLRNPSGERVAVALSVDGRNVIDARRTTAGRAAKWILAPGQALEIPGWQVSGETARRFFFTETSRSYAKWLGDTSNTGVIEAVFFRERRPSIAPIAPSEWPGRSGDDGSEARKDGNANRRESALQEKAQGGAEDGGRSAGPDAPARDARRRVEGSFPGSPAIEADELAATGIGSRTEFRVREVRFEEDPVPAACVRVRYEFRPELVRLGVLPRETAPSWRDRSRGFEPDYAPDPYDRRHR